MKKGKSHPREGADFALRADEFVAVAGELVAWTVESGRDPGKIDHFWLTLRAGRFGLVRISINTFSTRHAADGFDPRMRLGLVGSKWSRLPEPGVIPSAGLNYATFEREEAILFREIERAALEELLAGKAARAIFVEGWGALYLRNHLGIHQVHSRRASCSVPTDLVGRDGALRFYYRESFTELFLFKYCGQP